MYPSYSDSDTDKEICVRSQQNVVNQLRQTVNMFQNANFNNCNFTFQMPK